MSNTPTISAGVVVGRFQIDDLHEGHYDLLKDVQDRHTNLVIIIGTSPCRCTVNNPLDLDTRRRMLMRAFPSAKIGYIEDCYSDEAWSEKLDTVISAKTSDDIDVVLYGSRDSFIPHYSGKYPVKALIQRRYISASEIRKQLSVRSRHTVDFRAGAIWYSLNQYPSALPTVDVAVLHLDKKEIRILLGKRNTEDKFRLIGGFVAPGETYEDAAYRELYEEASIKAEDVTPMRSFFVDDWRYKSEQNKITTMLYVVSAYTGTPEPDDDIDELAWFTLDSRLLDRVVPNHLQMVDYLISTYAKTA